MKLFYNKYITILMTASFLIAGNSDVSSMKKEVVKKSWATSKTHSRNGGYDI